MRLSAEDVRRLSADPSPDARVETAAQVAQLLDLPGLSDGERTLAEEIVRIFVRDAEMRVRAALAEHLKASPRLPHELALALARDFAAVALPLLEFSVVLRAEDLVALVR